MTENEVKAIASTGETFTMEQVGVSISRQKLIDTIANAPKAGIIFVKGYEGKNNYGEVADYVYLKGASYENMKHRSLVKLDLLQIDPNFSIEVKYNVWVDANGTEHNRKAKDRTLKKVTRRYNAESPMLYEAFNKVRTSLLAPRPAHTEYEGLGNGIYQQDDGTLHIRDCIIIRKETIREGDYPIKASSELVALSDAIQRLLPISKYRQVRLDGRFDYIAVNGELVMQSEDGGKAYVTFSEYKDNIEPRIVRTDAVVHPEKTAKTIKELTDPLT